MHANDTIIFLHPSITVHILRTADKRPKVNFNFNTLTTVNKI